MKIQILNAILIGATCLLTSCVSPEYPFTTTVDYWVPAAAGTEAGAIRVDGNTSLTTVSRIVPQDGGLRWATGPEGILIGTGRSRSGQQGLGYPGYRPGFPTLPQAAAPKRKTAPPQKSGGGRSGGASSRGTALDQERPKKMANIGSEVFP